MSNEEKSEKTLDIEKENALIEKAKLPDTGKKGLVPPEIPVKPIEEPIEPDPGESQSGTASPKSPDKES